MADRPPAPTGAATAATETPGLPGFTQRLEAWVEEALLEADRPLGVLEVREALRQRGRPVPPDVLRDAVSALVRSRRVRRTLQGFVHASRMRPPATGSAPVAGAAGGDAGPGGSQP
jgi:hypothetical protein